MKLVTLAERSAIIGMIVFALAGCNAFNRATPQALPTIALDSGDSTAGNTEP